MSLLRTFSTDSETEKILSRLPKREASEFIRTSIREKASKNFQCVILCGGLGTRLYPITKDMPKSMVRISGKPFLEYQLMLLKKNGIKNVVLCIGYKSEQIKSYFGDGKKFGMKISYGNPRDSSLGMGGVIKAAENLLEGRFFLLYGDSYLPIDFQDAMNYFLFSKKKAVMTVYKNHDTFDKSNVAVEGNLVSVYNKTKRNLVYIDYGLSILDKSVIENLPQKEKIDMSSIFGMLIEKRELAAFEVDKRFYEIGSFQGLKDFEEFVKKEGLQ